MRPVARVVRAGGHVAERRDHFLLADNAGIRECRCVCLAVCTKRLLRLLRCHGRRRKKQCPGQHKYLHNGLHSLVRHQGNGRSWRRSLSAPTRHPWSEQARRGLGPSDGCQHDVLHNIFRDMVDAGVKREIEARKEKRSAKRDTVMFGFMRQLAKISSQEAAASFAPN